MNRTQILLFALSAPLPQWFLTSSILLTQQFRTSSALLPQRFRTSSALPPHFFRSGSSLLPHFFRTASRMRRRTPLWAERMCASHSRPTETGARSRGSAHAGGRCRWAGGRACPSVGLLVHSLWRSVERFKCFTKTFESFCQKFIITLHRALHDGRPGFPGADGRLPIRQWCGRVYD